MTKAEALKTYYGYDAFREGQEPIIDALLSGRDAMAIMPTGAGKSVCYQIPALLLPGITLVISPLVSLMRDQVMALKAAGVCGFSEDGRSVSDLLKMREAMQMAKSACN